MEDIKSIIAQNVVQLRRKSGMTQIELAEKLNYSDKAVSKWERGESVPDISVLKSIADLFGVTVDYLITPGHDVNAPAEEEDSEEEQERLRRKHRMHGMVTGMSILLVWLIAASVFVPLDIALPDAVGRWITLLFAVPASMLVWLVFNAIWFNRRRNYLIISLLMWTLIVAMHLSFILLGHHIWQLYLFGIPGQLIIILWSVIGKKN